MLRSVKSHGCASDPRVPPPPHPTLRLDPQVLETVRSHTLLGLVIQENLKQHELFSMIVSKAKHLHISLVISIGGVSQLQSTLLLSASLSYFRPRVHCCLAWYDALPAHRPSKIKRVQMPALRIIHLWKLYSLLKSLDLRTGAVSSVIYRFSQG